MARGTPDGRMPELAYAAQISDLGYITNMLWGFAPVDGQGRPIYFDTFNNGLGGFASVTTGAAIAPSIYQTSPSGLIYSPPKAALLSPGVSSGDASQLSREFYLGSNARLGLEIGFAIANTTPDHYFRLTYRRDSANDRQATIRFLHSSGAWDIATTPGGNITIKTVGLPSAGRNLLQQVKIVGDWSTGKYVRALIGDNLIDISSYTMSTASSSYDGYVNAVIQAYSYGAGSSNAYIGYVLITKDEP